MWYVRAGFGQVVRGWGAGCIAAGAAWIERAGTLIVGRHRRREQGRSALIERVKDPTGTSGANPRRPDAGVTAVAGVVWIASRLRDLLSLSCVEPPGSFP